MSQLQTRFHRLERLCKWEQVDHLNTLILQGSSCEKLAKWATEEGFKISSSKLYEYKKLLLHALTNSTTVEQMLLSTTPTTLDNPISNIPLDIDISNVEMLDEIIKKGYQNLVDNPPNKIQDILKAVELKHKLTMSTSISEQQFQQYRLIEEGKFSAILAAVMTYIPTDLHEEVFNVISKTEFNYLKANAPHLLKDYQDQNTKAGIDIEYDTEDSDEDFNELSNILEVEMDELERGYQESNTPRTN